MSLDQNVSPSPTSSPEAPAVSAIENEVPSYRAVCPHAVFALFAALMAGFSFAHPFFLVCALVAVVLGFYAEHKIQRYSDVLTGRGLAQAGIALGMIFGLGTLTIQTVQSQLRKAEAARFSRRLVEVLKNGSFEEAIWYRQVPDIRRGKSAEAVVDEVRKSAKEPHMFELHFGTLKELQQRAHAPGQDIRFVRIEDAGTIDMSNYAAALIEVHGPGTETYPKKEQYALLLVKSLQDPKSGKNEWWLDNITYPYAPNTFVPPAKTSGDGHGHAH